LPCRRIGHPLVEQEQAVAVVEYIQMAFAWDVQVVELVGDFVLRQGTGEESQSAEVDLLYEEDPVDREREEVRAQQVVGVDGGAPRLADAAGRGNAARVEAAEDASQHVVGKQIHDSTFLGQLQWVQFYYLRCWCGVLSGIPATKRTKGEAGDRWGR
jgi:hypothetical protein